MQIMALAYQIPIPISTFVMGTTVGEKWHSKLTEKNPHSQGGFHKKVAQTRGHKNSKHGPSRQKKTIGLRLSLVDMSLKLFLGTQHLKPLIFSEVIEYDSN